MCILKAPIPPGFSMDELSTTPSSLDWSETLTIHTEPLTDTTEDIHDTRSYNQKVVPMIQDSQQQDSEGEFSGGKLNQREMKS